MPVMRTKGGHHLLTFAAAALVAGSRIAAAKWPLRGPRGHVESVPASFDCGMRKLAYEYGKQLLPRLRDFESLFYALGLNEESCRGQLSPSATPSSVVEAPLGLHDIFVDPVLGSDAHEGSEHAPKQTIQEAVNVAALQKVAVVLRGGVHYLEETLTLGAEHSGLALRSYPGETPIVSGGKRLSVTWTPFNVTQGNGGPNIYRANVKSQVSTVPGLQVEGKRATRARYPNLPGGIEVSPGYGRMIDSGQAVWTPPNFKRFGPVVYYTDEMPEHRRNNSADNWFQEYMIGTNGLCSVYDPPVSYWCSQKPSGGGAFPFRTPSGVTPKPGVLPRAPYADTSQMELFVWRPARWANWMFRVANHAVDSNTSAGNFTFGHGGFQGARGENYGGDFFVENVFEELDNPGEFFFNESSGDLFLYFNGTGSPPDDMEVVVPQLRTLVNVSGTQWAPVRDLIFDGVKFVAARSTYMEPHGVPSGGDWALERTGALFLEGSERVTVQGCSFERLDGHAVFISGYNRNATIQDNNFEYIGGSAMASWGYTNETANSGFPYYRPNTHYPEAGVDGTDGNHPFHNRILRNLVREVGLYEKQNSFYVQAKTARTEISGNVFFNGPRAGINFNDGFGGGDEISYNLVFSTCRESGDHGPFNSWDRQPYLTTVRSGRPSMIMAWREIHHNFLIDNYSPQENVDNDDGSGYYKTHDNFMVYGGQGMKNDFGGHDNHHYNNIYAFAGQAMGVSNTLMGHEDWFFNNKVVLTGTNVGSVQCKEPKTKLADNRYFTSTGNITECGKDLTVLQQEMGMDPGSTVHKTPAAAQILEWAKELLEFESRHATEIVI